MKYLNVIVVFLIFLLSSCYGVNEKNSYISRVSSCCTPDSVWTAIYNKYQPINKDSLAVQNILKEFENLPSKTNVIYFSDEPKEYVGISENGMFIRYVYNEKLATQVLCGLSPQLDDTEKIRVILRINAILFNNLNEEGRKESVILLRESCNEFLEKNKD